MRRRLCCLAAAAVLAACSAPSRPSADDIDNGMEMVPTAEPPPARPPAPVPQKRLARDRTVAEAPFAPTSAQGAADVVQTYYALIEAGRFAEARKLWPGEPSASDPAFAARFGRYDEYHARIGAPGEIEGAAGSSFVEVPVMLYGRLKSGEAFSRRATATLRRVNDVPGSTADQRRWHIYRIEEAGPG